jgi:hypothetical protein
MLIIVSGHTLEDIAILGQPSEEDSLKLGQGPHKFDPSDLVNQQSNETAFFSMAFYTI